MMYTASEMYQLPVGSIVSTKPRSGTGWVELNGSVVELPGGGRVVLPALPGHFMKVWVMKGGPSGLDRAVERMEQHGSRIGR